MQPIELKLKDGPFGDETSLYDVVIHKEGMTIQDLIDYAVNERKGDWGYVNIMGNNGWLDKKYSLEYRWGSIVSDNIPENLKNKPILKCTAGGGWSRMDYDIYGI